MQWRCATPAGWACVSTTQSRGNHHIPVGASAGKLGDTPGSSARGVPRRLPNKIARSPTAYGVDWVTAARWATPGVRAQRSRTLVRRRPGVSSTPYTPRDTAPSGTIRAAASASEQSGALRSEPRLTTSSARRGWRVEIHPKIPLAADDPTRTQSVAPNPNPEPSSDIACVPLVSISGRIRILNQPNLSSATSPPPRRTACGSGTSPTCAAGRGGRSSRASSTSSHG
jgi:hypothetical protein